MKKWTNYKKQNFLAWLNWGIMLVEGIVLILIANFVSSHSSLTWLNMEEFKGFLFGIAFLELFLCAYMLVKHLIDIALMKFIIWKSIKQLKEEK